MALSFSGPFTTESLLFVWRPTDRSVIEFRTSKNHYPVLVVDNDVDLGHLFCICCNVMENF
jgi:hypothetical protein